MTRYSTSATWRPFSSSTFVCSAAGVVAPVLGWALLEPFFQEGGSTGHVGLANAFLFPLVAGTVSACLTAVNRTAASLSSRAIITAAAFGMAFAGTYLVLIPSRIVFNWFTFAAHFGAGMPRSAGFSATLAGRALSWGLVGTIIGLGTGLVTGQRGKILNGILSGLLAGLMAGMLFDPLHALVSATNRSTWISRLVGFIMLGGMTGFLIGLLEDATRKGRLLVTSGPRAGTLLVLDAKPCAIGSTAACDLVFPADPELAQPRALVQKVGLKFELLALGEESTIQVNRSEISRTILSHGDFIRIDGMDLLFSDPRRNTI